MAGFQVANFTFGKNIVDADLKRAQIAAQERASARPAAVQMRGQDIAAQQSAARLAEQSAQAEAARAENARQFDETLADKGAQREENARQFDETQAQKKREYDDKRADIARAQSWDDALKMQQMEKEDQEFEIRNAELSRILAIRQKEDEERAHQQELVESAYGNAIIATELGGGFLTQKQVQDFNERNGTSYNYVGKIDPTTGKPFTDGKIHFLEYALDDKGQLTIDQKSGRPMLNQDNPISSEFYGRAMDGYFGKYKDRLSGSGMSPERMEIENKKIGIREKELAERQRRASERQEAMRAKLAASISKNFDATSMGAGMDGESNKKLQIGLQNVLMDFFNTASGGEEANPQESPDKNDGIPEFNPKGSYNIGDRFRRNGKMYEVGEDEQPHLVAEGE